MTALHKKMNQLLLSLPPEQQQEAIKLVEKLRADAQGSMKSGKKKPSVGQKLAALGKQVESEPCELPHDLASNHDHYLHGLSKRS